jgi:hypothetical protein
MKVRGARTVRVGTWMVGISLTLAPHRASAQGAQAVRLSGSDGAWVLPENARTRDVDGRPALQIGRGQLVLSSGIDFESGTIEFDVWPDDETLFVGVLFRRDPGGDAERVYLRPYDSDEWSAVQYDPDIRGSGTWQLYPEFNAQASLPRNAWIHVRLEVDGPRMEVYVGGGSEPTMVVPRLRGTTTGGGLAFWATNGVDERPTAAVTRIVVRPSQPTRAAAQTLQARPGILARWEVAGPSPAPEEGPVREFPGSLEWRTVAAEEEGLVSLTRHMGSPPGARTTAWARTTLRAEAPANVPLDLAYSDDVTVFLNGRPLYSGHGGWSTRYPGFFGALRRGFETVWLPLRAGDNELLLAVSDALPFGWGFAARLLEDGGARPVPQAGSPSYPGLPSPEGSPHRDR